MYKQAVVRKHNKPRPRVAHRAIARFLGNDQKCSQVVPWSLHIFPENFMQIGPAIFSYLSCWRRNKEIDRKQYPVLDTVGGGVSKFTYIILILKHRIMNTFISHKADTK